MALEGDKKFITEFIDRLKKLLLKSKTNFSNNSDFK